MRTAILFLLALSGVATADESHGWAVVYTKQVINPNISTAMYCPDNPHCNDVPMDVEVTEWFPSKEMALARLNGRAIVSTVYTVDFPITIEPKNLIGIFQCQRFAVKQVQTGTHKAMVTEEKEKDVPTLEWQ